jgi:hypothetical protein
VERVARRQAEGQLQPSNAKQARTSLASGQDHGEAVEELLITPESRCEKAMDEFLNAAHHPHKCCRKVVNVHFGNIDLRKCYLYSIRRLS